MGYLPHGGIVVGRMYESLAKLPASTAMGLVPVLKHILSAVHGLLPYHRWVVNALVPHGRGAGHAYLESGSPRVRWVDARVPPWLG
jgi:hypothetical protein